MRPRGDKGTQEVSPVRGIWCHPDLFQIWSGAWMHGCMDACPPQGGVAKVHHKVVSARTTTATNFSPQVWMSSTQTRESGCRIPQEEKQHHHDVCSLCYTVGGHMCLGACRLQPAVSSHCGVASSPHHAAAYARASWMAPWSSPASCISITMSHPPSSSPLTYSWGKVGQLEYSCTRGARRRGQPLPAW